MNKPLFKIILVFHISLFLFGCRKDVPPVPEPIIQEATDVNKFIYNGLSAYYLWVDNVPALNNTKYKNSDSLNLFLNKYSDPEELFFNLLYQYGTIDKWSFIVDSAKEIEN